MRFAEDHQDLGDWGEPGTRERGLARGVWACRQMAGRFSASVAVPKAQQARHLFQVFADQDEVRYIRRAACGA